MVMFNLQFLGNVSFLNQIAQTNARKQESLGFLQGLVSVSIISDMDLNGLAFFLKQSSPCQFDFRGFPYPKGTKKNWENHNACRRNSFNFMTTYGFI